MIESTVTRTFWRLFAKLPRDVQQEVRRAYAIFRADPYHPSLRFKKLQGEEHIYSARVGLGYRAIGVMKSGRMVWFWVGTHAEYDRLA